MNVWRATVVQGIDVGSGFTLISAGVRRSNNLADRPNISFVQYPHGLDQHVNTFGMHQASDVEDDRSVVIPGTILRPGVESRLICAIMDGVSVGQMRQECQRLLSHGLAVEYQGVWSERLE